jgi:hypothetical protein
MYTCRHVKYPFACEILMKLKFSRQIFEKSTNIIFIKNPSSGSRDVPHGQTDMNVTVTSHNFANAPKNTVLKRFEILSKTEYYHFKIRITWAQCRFRLTRLLIIQVLITYFRNWIHIFGVSSGRVLFKPRSTKTSELFESLKWVSQSDGLTNKQAPSFSR